jgi:hypothetical protein
MAEVWVPDTPLTRSYTCPNCHRGVKAFRIGDSSSYWVMNADDENKDHDCKGKNGKVWKGAIPNNLLGYKPKKEKKDEPQQTSESGASNQPSIGGQTPKGG